jgi:Rod binding domain-containing protein
MSDNSLLGVASSPAISPLTTQTDKLLRHRASEVTENNKIEKSAKDFESILLGNWLQHAEESFGSVPGGENDDDADPGKDQFQAIAMQSLGSSMTAAGGIGIAKMIAQQLHKADTKETPPTDQSARHVPVSIPLHKVDGIRTKDPGKAQPALAP